MALNVLCILVLCVCACLSSQQYLTSLRRAGMNTFGIQILYFSSEVMANYLAWQTTPPGEDSGSSYIFMLFLVFLLSFGCLLHGTTKVQHFVTSLQCGTMPNCLRLHVSDFTNFYRFYSIVLLGDLKARRWVVLQSEQVWWVSHSKRPRCKITKFGQDMLKFVKTVSTLLCHNTIVSLWGSCGIALSSRSQNWPLERAEGPAGASPSQENMGTCKTLTKKETKSGKGNTIKDIKGFGASWGLIKVY